MPGEFDSFRAVFYLIRDKMIERKKKWIENLKRKAHEVPKAKRKV